MKKKFSKAEIKYKKTRNQVAVAILEYFLKHNERVRENLVMYIKRPMTEGDFRAHAAGRLYELDEMTSWLRWLQLKATNNMSVVEKYEKEN